MVSLWPFKGNQVASFEKTLSSLTEKISRSNVKRDQLLTRSRRIKVLWTIYTSFVYLLYTLIMVLVTGKEKWGSLEYTLVGGSPVLIYLVWLALHTYYGYRISSTENRLKDLYAQREIAVQSFKKATKYDTTQQLLEKYGIGVADQQSRSKSSHALIDTNDDSESVNQIRAPSSSQGNSRIKVLPPPTANIKPKALPIGLKDSGPSTTALSSNFEAREQPISHEKRHERIDTMNVLNSNLGSTASVTAQKHSDSSSEGGNWYDRIVDLLLGEDETRSINRLALICSHCRLVNGQAPPGIKRLDEVGRWRCSGCGELNNQAKELENYFRSALSQIGDPSTIDPRDQRGASQSEIQDDSKFRSS